ncbi:MAG TPA: hypothetical protein VN823_12560 [Stellaceae bacterium]|nr:hypothetical protein [Stellaceae bacterium]
MPYRIAAVALVLLLAGCQPLPHPFEDDRPAPRAPIISLRNATSVAVAPVAGLDGDARDQLAGAIAGALVDLDVLASAESSSRGSLSLVGTARSTGSGVAVDWRLVDPGGQALGQGSDAAAVGLDSLNRGDAAALKALALATAPNVAKLLQDDAPAAQAEIAPLREVVVLPVSGAPGNGGDALKLAMTAALTQAKLTVLPEKTGEAKTLSVVGSVTLDRPQNGQQHIAITWALMDPAGKQLGVVKQENAVPQGSLDGRWGDVANLVAAAAAPGILAIIEKAEQVRSGT